MSRDGLRVFQRRALQRRRADVERRQLIAICVAFLILSAAILAAILLGRERGASCLIDPFGLCDATNAAPDGG
jgi:hypothetical protein